MYQKLTFLLIVLFISAGTMAQSIDSSVLNQVIKKSADTHSDALLIVQNGKKLVEKYDGGKERPIYVASAGKSLTCLGILRLLELGFIDSLDQPVHSIFPEWKQGTKKDITIRMLLNNTSGMQNYMDASIELEPPPNWQVNDIVKLALASEISYTPGTTVFYNNKAVALLGGIIHKASGKRMDVFFEEYFYKPMGITGYDWIKDKSGNPTAHGAFILKPTDFLKFGLLVLNKGVYNGKRYISEKWINEALKQGQEKDPIWGLLWWRIPASQQRVIDAELISDWKRNGIDPATIEKATPLIGKKFNSRDEFFAEANKVLGENWFRSFPPNVMASRKIFSKEILAYYADGFRGNFLVIVPQLNLVAIRLADGNDFNWDTDVFGDFPQMISNLISK